ncbi:MAG: hypothetical protein WCA32_10550 [Chromatiaceae bacterium]
MTRAATEIVPFSLKDAPALIERMLLNMITTSLYLGLPLLWSGMMAWVGVKVGQSIDLAASPMRNPAADAGRQGGAIGKTAVSKGLRR